MCRNTSLQFCSTDNLLMYLINLLIAQGPHQSLISHFKENSLLLSNNESQPSDEIKSQEEPKTQQGSKITDLWEKPWKGCN